MSAELEEIRNSINKDVFNALFNSLLPEEIYEVIKNQIIKSKIVRKNALWVYDFTPLNSSGFALKQTLKSELHNLGDKSYKEDYEVIFRTGGNDSETKLERIIYEYNGNIVEDVSVDSANLSDGGKIKLKLDIPVGEHADITLVFKTNYRDQIVADSYYSTHALINATLIVNHPKGYFFKLFECFSSEMKREFYDSTSSIYKIRGAILPGQGMTFHLAKDSSHN